MEKSSNSRVFVGLGRFVNHFDPSVSKANWMDAELETLNEKYGVWQQVVFAAEAFAGEVGLGWL